MEQKPKKCSSALNFPKKETNIKKQENAKIMALWFQLNQTSSTDIIMDSLARNSANQKSISNTFNGICNCLKLAIYR